MVHLESQAVNVKPFTRRSVECRCDNEITPNLCRFGRHRRVMKKVKTNVAAGMFLIALASFAWSRADGETPLAVDIPNGPIPLRILAQSPADTTTDLQVICLFRSSPANTLHGSLAEIDAKMKGLLSRVRTPELFRGELGETLLIAPPHGSLAAKRLLVIGLGDSGTFTPQRMELVGEIVYREAGELGVAHPFFAPTVLDGGVTKFATGQVSEEVAAGFLRAARLDKVLRDDGASAGSRVTGLTFLAGQKNVSGTQEGIEKAIAGAGK